MIKALTNLLGNRNIKKKNCLRRVIHVLPIWITKVPMWAPIEAHVINHHQALQEHLLCPLIRLVFELSGLQIGPIWLQVSYGPFLRGRWILFATTNGNFEDLLMCFSTIKWWVVNAGYCRSITLTLFDSFLSLGSFLKFIDIWHIYIWKICQCEI